MHTLRRLYATTLADAGVPLETIARMMRHESPVTTLRCYLKADPRRMDEAQSKVDDVLALREHTNISDGDKYPSGDIGSAANRRIGHLYQNDQKAEPAGRKK